MSATFVGPRNYCLIWPWCDEPRSFDVTSKLQCDGPVQPRTRRGGIVDQLRGREKFLKFLTDARALAMRQLTDA